MTDAAPYDKALAETLDNQDDAAELRDRLLSGGASADDRRDALSRLDDQARHRFDLAHPSPPAESAQPLDAGELAVERADVEDERAWKESAERIRERLAEALAEGRPVESLVTLRVRVGPPDAE